MVKQINYYEIPFKLIDFRKSPELYQIGKGEQGVLSVEPYKSEILPFWRFKNPEIAQISANHIYTLFLTYLEQDDFVGADMARKFLQMGYTRSRRYANHKSGKKYSTEDMVHAITPTHIPPYHNIRNQLHFVITKTKKILPLDADSEKVKCADIFYKNYLQAKNNEKYKKLKKQWQEKYG